MAIDIKVAGEAAAAKRALGQASSSPSGSARARRCVVAILEPATFLSLLLEPPRL